MIICFFGIYDPSYARNRVLMDGLSANGVEVVECRIDPSVHRRFAGLVALYRQARRVRQHPIDLVIVGFPGHKLVWLARLLFPRKRIIFDAFLSLFDSNVCDRKVHAPGSAAAKLDWFWDWLSCRLADRVLLDTDQHIEYLSQTFGMPKQKFIRVWIGADDTMFYPRDIKLPETFTVHFHGSFIPLQGVEHILDAAALLRHEDFRFQIVGGGQEYEHMQVKAERLGLTNLRFAGKVPVASVPEYIAASHICLGIFGSTGKTGRVIPNKVYESIAMGKPVITADTPAIREVFTDESSVLLCRASDGASLAEAIRRLKGDAALRDRIAAGGLRLFRSTFAPARLAAELLAKLS